MPRRKKPKVYEVGMSAEERRQRQEQLAQNLAEITGHPVEKCRAIFNRRVEEKEMPPEEKQDTTV